VSNTDIIARLKLNAQGFTSELNKSLGDVEQRVGRSGSVIGRNISDGIGRGLDDVAARVPVVGGALSGLSGAALVAGGAIGGVALALGHGLAEAEGFARSVRGLDAVLKASGNSTGLARDQLVAFAEEMEGGFAIAAEEIINAEKVLSSFDGVAGSTFTRSIELAADLAAVYGGDLSSNSEKLGIVLQNLAQGKVEGLRKGFKFLGDANLDVIEKLAETGRTADAQVALLDALQNKVGGAGKAEAQGLSGAFFRLSDAVGDATRQFVEQTGIYDAAVRGVNGLEVAVSGLIAKMKEMNGLQISASALSFFLPGGPLLGSAQSALLGQQANTRGGGRGGPVRNTNVQQGIDEDPFGLNSHGFSINDIIARQAAHDAYDRRSPDDPKKPKKAGKSDAEREAEAAAREVARLNEELEKTTASMEDQVRIAQLRADGLEREADVQAAIASINAKFPDLATKTNAELAQSLHISEAEVKVLKDKLELVRDRAVAEANIKADERDDAEFDRAAKAAQRVARQANEELARQKEEQYRAEQDQIRDLAGFYRRAFEGGSGSIWKDFKEAGKDAIAVLAAQFTLSMLSGKPFDFNSALGSIGAVTGNPLISLAGSLFGGQGGQGGLLGGLFGGKGSILGGGLQNPPTMSAAPAQGAGQLAGAASSAAGALSGVTAAAGPVGAAIAIQQTIGNALGFDSTTTLFGGLLGGFVGSLLKKDKKAITSLSTRGDDTIDIYGTTGTSAKRRKQSNELAHALDDALIDLADQFGTGLADNVVIGSIGNRNKKFTFDPSGQGFTKRRNGAQQFDTAEEAVKAAIESAIDKGVIEGVRESTQRLLKEGSDLQKAIEKAAKFESVFDRLDQRLDPVGFAIDQLNKEFKGLIRLFDEAGASTEEMAKLQQLYNLELEDVKTGTKSASASLKEFLDSFKVGSDSPFSLRDQEAAARAALQPFLDKIDAGQSIDQDKYLAAAESFLDVERQLNGSTGAYFRELDRIQAATNKAIATIDNATPIRTASDPFAERTASATQATAEIAAEQTAILRDTNLKMAELVRLMQERVGGFVGARRGF
jgi:hypothetical protein